MSRGIHVDWLRGLEGEEKEQFESLLRGSLVLERLKEILSDRERTLNTQETTIDDYGSPSWAYRQADRNGYRRCLKQMKELLNHIEE